jgi:NADH-quinone oxidoreductase subunit J
MTETLPLISFYFFGAITVLAALGVITVKNPVHAALCLVLTFFSTACVWLLADAEFLAIALVLVYVGAVMVLFLFVVMMLDIDLVPLREGFVRAMPVGLIVAVVMLVEMLTLIGVRSMQIAPPAEPAAAAGVSNTTWLAIVAAIPLTLRRRVGVKAQDPAKQVAVTARERIRIVKMAAEVANAPDKGTTP